MLQSKPIPGFDKSVFKQRINPMEYLPPGQAMAFFGYPADTCGDSLA